MGGVCTEYKDLGIYLFCGVTYGTISFPPQHTPSTCRGGTHSVPFGMFRYGEYEGLQTHTPMRYLDVQEQSHWYSTPFFTFPDPPFLSLQYFQRKKAMTSYEVKDSDLDALGGKTVLIVGAATGIGRSTVLLAHRKYTTIFPFLVSGLDTRDTVTP